jgi:hypothetical protein
MSRWGVSLSRMTPLRYFAVLGCLATCHIATALETDTPAPRQFSTHYLGEQSGRTTGST